MTATVEAAARVRRPRLAVPVVSTLLMLAVLLGLGFWQVHRLHWKAGILAAIDRAEQSPPVPLDAEPQSFQKVAATGHWRGGPAAWYGAEVRDTPAGPRMGAQWLDVLERDGAAPVLVDRGWVPEGTALPDDTASVTAQGYVRRPDHPGWFSPAADPATRHFYTLDPAAIGAAIGAPGLAPFTLVALGSAPFGRYPQPAASLPRPPNDHLAYALTWFGLAGVLVVMFASYARRAWRR